MPDHTTRQNRLRKKFKATGIDGLLVTNVTNVSYLTGFTGDSSFLLLTPQDAILISDARFTVQLKEQCPDLDLHIRNRDITMAATVAKWVRKTKRHLLGVESANMTVAFFDQLGEALPSVRLVPSVGLVESLREIKDREEIAAIRAAVRCAERSVQVVRASLQPEMTEKQIADQLDHQIRLFGGTGCSFPPIVAVGPRAALPHADPSEKRLEESDFVLIDWGATVDQYVSDLTRVFCTARISPKLTRIYEVVLRAQCRAISAIKPGALMCDVDSAARQVIAEAGHGKHFGHGLGHGIGQQVHEAPSLAAIQDQPLRAGMVVTVEPGIYLPGWGGVRIEDDVLVTRTGHEVLSTLSRELDDCVVG